MPCSGCSALHGVNPNIKKFKKKQTPDHQVIRSCGRHEFLAFDYINTFEDVQLLITQLTIDPFSISKLKYKNKNIKFFLSVVVVIHQDTMQCSNEWNVFKKLKQDPIKVFSSWIFLHRY